MAIKTIVRTVFRNINGRIVPIKVNVPDGAVNGLYHEQKTLSNYNSALKGFKEFRTNFFKRAAMFKPGGIKDPVRVATENKMVEDFRLKELKDNVMKHYGKDEFSQAKGKKAADRVVGISAGLSNVFKAPVDPSSARHFTAKEISKLSKRAPSKLDFMEHMNDVKGFDVGDAFEVLGKRSHGASGKPAITSRLHARKHDAMRIQRAVNAQVKIKGAGPDKIHRIISARGKGITFKKVNGKLVPMRKK